jgi:hypothetical protein
MNLHTPRALAAAAALALALGACSDIPTAAPDRLATAGPPALTVSSGGATLIPNTTRYRWNGGKPATGRSGSAALQAFALLGKDGRTELEYRPIPADPWRWVWGTMTRAQVKGLDADSTVMFTYNENNLNAEVQRTQFQGLTRGQYLRVQANVTGIDPHRVDVVTVTERVKLRPDLAVHLQMAPEVPALRHIPINATISELNGDVGAYGQCTLYVDGAVADWSYGIWVDAGDAVTCAFSHAFSPGTHNVQVEVGSVSPGDWDESNNRSQVIQVEATGGPTQFNYSASATATRSRSQSSYMDLWTNPSVGLGSEYQNDSGMETDVEYAEMYGWIERAVSGPVQVEVSQASGGRTVHADSWTDEVGEGYYCGVRYGQGTMFHLCSYNLGGWPSTYFTYSRSAGTVTYHSRTYSRLWDLNTGQDIHYYHYNDVYTQDNGPLAGVRDDYSFRVRLTAGDVVLTAESDFPLSFSETAWTENYCSDYQSPWDGYTSHTCRNSDYHYLQWSGSDSYVERW